MTELHIYEPLARYKSWQYVENEIKRLAAQLKVLEVPRSRTDEIIGALSALEVEIDKLNDSDSLRLFQTLSKRVNFLIEETNND